MGGFVFSMGLLASQSLQSRTCNSEMAEKPAETRRAICILDSQPNQTGKGVVHFEQKSMFARTLVTGTFTGLNPGQLHGFHVHMYGDLSDGCTTAGPHYNPHGNVHAGPDDEVRHVGDLGNVQADSEGNGSYERADQQISLQGPFSVIGRSCVLHAGTDDLGRGGHELSLTTGNAGGRIACGVIGLRA